MDASAFVFFLLVFLLLAASIYCGIRCYQRGHRVLFLIGIFLPPAWWVGAFLPEAPER
jgi:hypothetical protein